MKTQALKIKRNTLPEFPNFKAVEVEDRNIIHTYTNQYKPVSCEYSFANLFCWGGLYDFGWSLLGDLLLIYSGEDKSIFMPLGRPDLLPEELVGLSYTLKRNFYGGNISLVNSNYFIDHPDVTNHFQFSMDDELSEYIYSTQKLSKLNGSKLGKKRNLINQFKNNWPNFRIENMNQTNIDSCRTLSDSLMMRRLKVDRSIREEQKALERAFDYFDLIGLEGLVLKVGAKTVAFAIFSQLHSMMYVTHYEKSDLDYKGAAQVINQETANFLEGKCEYINREQDLGIPGLRKAKLSYSPDLIYCPGTLVLKTNTLPNKMCGGF